MRALKTAIYSQAFLANLSPRSALYEDNGPGIKVGLQLLLISLFLYLWPGFSLLGWGMGGHQPKIRSFPTHVEESSQTKFFLPPHQKWISPLNKNFQVITE